MWLLLLLCVSWAACGFVASESEATINLMQFMTVPSTISAYDEAQELSCGELLMHAWSQHCKQVAVARDTKVVVCNNLIQSDTRGSGKQPAQEPYEATDAGIIMLLPDQQQQSGMSNHQQQERSTGQFVWRLRIVGPEIATPPVQYCPGNVAVAGYRLTLPGEYNVEVLLLYTGFAYISSASVSRSRSVSAGAVQKVQADAHTANFTIRVDTVPPDTLACGARSAASKDPKWCPPCQGYSQLGRWVVKAEGSTGQLVQRAISRTCIHTGSASSSHHRAGSSSSSSSSHMEVVRSCSAELKQLVQLQKEQQKYDALLTWQPYSCTLSAQEATSCRQRLLSQHGNICFVGDSVMKHLANRVAHQLGLTSPLSSSSSTTTTTNNNNKVAYVPDSFGEHSPAAANCSMLFRNFGQRPLAAAAAAAPTSTTSSSSNDVIRPLWTPSRYAAQVDLVAQQLAAAQRHRHPASLKVFWVTTTAYPLREDLHQRLGTDLRVDPYLLLFNKLASSIMHSYHIPVVDTYSIASPVSDLLLFEGGVRSLGHLVAMAQAQLVATVICPAA
jgi:hypothetical protein